MKNTTEGYSLAHLCSKTFKIELSDENSQKQFKKSATHEEKTKKQNLIRRIGDRFLLVLNIDLTNHEWTLIKLFF